MVRRRGSERGWGQTLGDLTIVQNVETTGCGDFWLCWGGEGMVREATSYGTFAVSHPHVLCTEIGNTKEGEMNEGRAQILALK